MATLAADGAQIEQLCSDETQACEDHSVADGAVCRMMVDARRSAMPASVSARMAEVHVTFARRVRLRRKAMVTRGSPG